MALAELFERLIAAAQPESTHRAFGWMEDAPGDISGFLADGYTQNNAVVMQSTVVPTVPAPTLDVQLRPFALAGDAAERDWSALVALSVATRGEQFSESATGRSRVDASSAGAPWLVRGRATGSARSR